MIAPPLNCAILNLVTFEAVAENLRESFRIIAAGRRARCTYALTPCHAGADLRSGLVE